jgi:quaternary ammonium compound-resistance protein SugE
MARVRRVSNRKGDGFIGQGSANRRQLTTRFTRFVFACEPRAAQFHGMHWTLLFVAAAFEIVWATGLKSTEGFTRLWPSVGVGSAMVASMGLLALAARGLPIGTAYAVWTGIGAAGTALAGITFFHESASPARLACLALIVGGVVGLKLLTK